MGKKIVLTEEQLKKVVLGTVNTESAHHLLEYARVGFMGKKNDYEVYVYTNDPGYIPHIHIRDSATQGSEFDACVELATNKYFSHGGHDSKLNSKQRKALAEFMEAPYRNAKYENNYEFAIEMWNVNNSEVNIAYNGRVPNYREIQGN